MSCVPRMSRSLMTWSYSLRWLSASASILEIMWFSFSFSALIFSITRSAFFLMLRTLLSSCFSCSFCCCSFCSAMCSFTSAESCAGASSAAG